ncbi:hypothetical protein [Sulfurimonas sp.]|uniref:hypothetical protein n=1 Tax=Sulfurimonas sp. TaxID=2022749 RepID=UPI003569E46C
MKYKFQNKFVKTVKVLKSRKEVVVPDMVESVDVQVVVLLVMMVPIVLVVPVMYLQLH